jgi:hypothetical protein
MNITKQVIQFQMEDGSPLYVEIEENAGGPRLVSNTTDGVAKAQSKFMDALQPLESAAKAVLNTFRDINQPEEISLEFGVKFNRPLS